jgi:uncharacterized alkaline shock family protein YloU
MKKGENYLGNFDKVMNNNEIGKINIADDVFGIISNIAASEIQGVKGLSTGLADDIAGLINKKHQNNKGVKIEIIENEIYLNLSVIVEFGVNIPDLAWKVQENVKRSVESMTEMKVAQINVHVAGISYSK